MNQLNLKIGDIVKIAHEFKMYCVIVTKITDIKYYGYIDNIYLKQSKNYNYGDIIPFYNNQIIDYISV